jgi:hypothetical protein
VIPFYDEFAGSLGDSLKKLTAGASVKTMGLAGLQGVSSAASIMASMGAMKREGQEAKRSAYLAAQDELMNATQAFVSGEGEKTGLRSKLADALGQRLAASGGSGIDGGQGVIQDNATAISERARRAEVVTRSNADILAARHRMNAIAAKMKGDAAEREANAGARAQLGSGILSGLMSIGKLFLL